jgi:hypothetical protein
MQGLVHQWQDFRTFKSPNGRVWGLPLTLEILIGETACIIPEKSLIQEILIIERFEIHSMTPRISAG